MRTIIKLGGQSVGNNHTLDHLFEFMELGQFETFAEKIGNTESSDDIILIYTDRFNNEYREAYAACDLWDYVNKWESIRTPIDY
jgi:hypothetical protein